MPVNSVVRLPMKQKNLELLIQLQSQLPLTKRCHCLSLFPEATMKSGALDGLGRGRIVVFLEKGHQLIVRLVSWLIG